MRAKQSFRIAGKCFVFFYRFQIVVMVLDLKSFTLDAFRRGAARLLVDVERAIVQNNIITNDVRKNTRLNYSRL